MKFFYGTFGHENEEHSCHSIRDYCWRHTR